MTILKIVRGAVLLATLALGACGRSAADDAPKLPLGHPGVATRGGLGERGGPTIRGEAKAALDSGNILYRAKAYPRALAQYRRAATLAPDEEAPLFGVLMVANVTRNAGLADSTTTRIRELNASATGGSSALSAAELRDIHARVIPTPHPPAKKP